jgi:hypothetical protein
MRKLVIVLIALVAVFAFISAYSGASADTLENSKASLAVPLSPE